MCFAGGFGVGGVWGGCYGGVSTADGEEEGEGEEIGRAGETVCGKCTKEVYL